MIILFDFRTIPTEPVRIVEKLVTTPVPIISKPYYSEPDQSYPYYPIYDDDVVLYKDDGKLMTIVNVKNF